jgi:hypothetical protein
LFQITYPGIIKPEPIEGQLEIEILVDLGYRVVNVLLVVTIAIITALVKETVQEFASDLPKTIISDDIGVFSGPKSMGWRGIPVVALTV